jgi:hypothetical protein
MAPIYKVSFRICRNLSKVVSWDFFHIANDLPKVTEQFLHELKDNLRNEDKDKEK